MTRTRHPLPFDRLSPQDFERLCLWLARREGYEEVEHLGASGKEQGRDLVARRDGRQVVFQCKREVSFGPQKAQAAVEKILELPEPERPAELVLIVSSSVSLAARKKARERCEGHFACTFWAGTELDEKVKLHEDLVDADGACVPGASNGRPVRLASTWSHQTLRPLRSQSCTARLSW